MTRSGMLPDDSDGTGLRSLNRGSVAVALGFAVVAALMFTPFFLTPFIVLLGRTLFLSMLLLLAFVATQRWPARLPRWLPRWVLTLLVIAVAAPLGTLLVYLFAVGGRLQTFTQSPERIAGFMILAGSALVLGLLIALAAQLRAREAQARAQALKFELERSTLERQALDARLSLLQAQIEPHFLFNTLANVQALVESGSPRAAQVLASLIAYLRAAVPRLHDRAATLADEAALVRAYLELMQLRMPDRLRFDVELPAALGARPFPPMALLTLVENAVRHGIDPLEDGGHIGVGAAADADGTLRAWVADSGVGLDTGAAPGTGLANLRARLAAAHGPGATLRLDAVEPHGLRAEITLPPATSSQAPRPAP